MNREYVVAELFGLIRKHETGYTGAPDESVGFAALGIDSVATVDIVVNAEKVFGVEIPDEVLGDFRKVGDLADYVLAETARPGGRAA